MSKQNYCLLLMLICPVMLAGPQGFSSLKILPGPREAGMGGAGCASASGPQAMIWNPAATFGSTSFAAAAGYTSWLEGSKEHCFFLTRQFGKTALGTGIRNFAAGIFEYREEIPVAEPLGIFQPVELSGYINISHQLGDTTHRLYGTLGTNLRYFYSKVMSYEMDGFGLDLGARLHTGSVSLGASLSDFGQTLSYVRERIWLPTRARTGAAVTTAIGQWNLTAATDFSFFVYSRQTRVNAGLEIIPVQPLRLRTGYEFCGKEGEFSSGFGLSHNYIALDYSLTILRHDMGSAHRISVRLTL